MYYGLNAPTTEGTKMATNDTPVVMTECGKRDDDYDAPGKLTVNGHYHYADGACDTEPPYEMGGPA